MLIVCNYHETRKQEGRLNGYNSCRSWRWQECSMCIGAVDYSARSHQRDLGCSKYVAALRSKVRKRFKCDRVFQVYN